jgi:hypothetical protein
MTSLDILPSFIHPAREWSANCALTAELSHNALNITFDLLVRGDEYVQSIFLYHLEILCRINSALIQHTIISDSRVHPATCLYCILCESVQAGLIHTEELTNQLG